MHARSWTDPGTGTTWHIRGAPLDARSARRLMLRADLLVLRAYGPRPAVGGGDERAGLFERVRQFLDGNAPRFTSFDLAEFRDDQRRVMLVVQESFRAGKFGASLRPTIPVCAKLPMRGLGRRRRRQGRLLVRSPASSCNVASAR